MLTFPRFGTSSPPLMIHLVYALLATARSSLRSRRELALENLALRQQLAVLKRSSKRPKLAKMDRAFWVALSRLSTAWQDILILVKPETVIGMVSQRLQALVVPTATSRILYVFVVLEHERRRVVHFNVTDGPSARWTGQQLVNAFPYDSAPKYVIRDRDKIYGAAFVRRAHALGIEQILTAPRSPWQSPYCERVIGTLRRECLDHVIVLPMVGGLHHRYTRRAA